MDGCFSLGYITKLCGRTPVSNTVPGYELQWRSPMLYPSRYGRKVATAPSSLPSNSEVALLRIGFPCDQLGKSIKWQLLLRQLSRLLCCLYLLIAVFGEQVISKFQYCCSFYNVLYFRTLTVIFFNIEKILLL